MISVKSTASNAESLILILHLFDVINKIAQSMTACIEFIAVVNYVEAIASNKM